MLDPDVLVDAVVAFLRDIPNLVSGLGSNPSAIVAFHDSYGVDSTLAKAVMDMPAPSVLVAWNGVLPGIMRGSDIECWKHHICIYIRPGNQAQEVTPAGLTELWVTIINDGKPHLNSVMAGVLPADLPTAVRRTDIQENDYLEATLVIPEIGDN